MMSATASHVVFVLSFASAFLVCYIASQFLSSVLNDVGYDLSGTIPGDEKQPENMSSQLIQGFSSNQLAQLAALVFTAVTSVAIFWKFSQRVFNPVCMCVERDETDASPESKKPVLDPQNWQEFRLIKKTIVSPNTAMWALMQLPANILSDLR